jgi:DNA-binding MarR family transcriptional regulator
MYIHIQMAPPRQSPPTRSSKTLVSDAAAQLEACPAAALRAAARRIGTFMDRALAPAGLGFAQAVLMAHIAAAPDDTIGALVRRTGLDQSTLSRNLRALERAGLVEIAMVESDLRRRAVWLTETGARRLERAMPLWRHGSAMLGGLLGPRTITCLVIAAQALHADEAGSMA